MSIPLNDQDPRMSALKDGIIIGILACLKEFKIEATKNNVAQVLRSQQQWNSVDVDYYLKFFGLD